MSKIPKLLEGLWETKDEIVNTYEDLASQKPFGDHKFYVYTILKEDERGKRLYHQPRLTRGQYVPGTTCVKINPVNNEVELIWTLPNLEGINLYKKGKLFANEIVFDCIRDYLSGKPMPRKDETDLTDEEIIEIYRSKSKRVISF